MIKLRSKKSILVFALIFTLQTLSACANINAEDVNEQSDEDNNVKMNVSDRNGTSLKDNYVINLCEQAVKNKQEDSENSNEIKMAIDLNVQQGIKAEIEKIPNISKYSFVVMNPNNGEVIAVSENSSYIPSSTFKVITSAVLLNTDTIEKDTAVDSSPYNAGNTTIKSLPPLSKEITFEDALIMKCNPVFARLTCKMGKEKFLSYLKKFGIEVPEEKHDLTDEELSLYSIGQIEVTPMQMAAAYSVIANGGKYVEPTLLLQSEEDTSTEKNVISENTSEIMKDLLHKSIMQYKKSNSNISGICGMSSQQNSDTISHNFAGIGYTDENEPVCLVVNISTSELHQSINEQLIDVVNGIMDVIADNNI